MVSVDFLFFVQACIHVHIVIVFVLMLSELAPRIVFTLFSTAPPHGAPVFALMSATRPIEVLLLVVLLVAVLTYLEGCNVSEATTFHLLYALFERLNLRIEPLYLGVRGGELFLQAIVLVLEVMLLSFKQNDDILNGLDG